MQGKVVASGRLPSYDYQSVEYAGEIVHRITVKGPIDLEHRLPLYQETLAINQTSNYFCILDNSDGHENTLSRSDMVLLDSILVEGGIKNFYGVTITTDPSYAGIVKLAGYSAEASRLNAEMLATPDPAEAERFILEKLETVTG